MKLENKMYFIIFLISIFIEATVPTTINENDEGFDGVLINRAYIRNYQAPEGIFSCPGNTSENVCAEDCQTLLTCQSESTQPIITRNCATFSSSTPYCIPGEVGCSSRTDYNNPQCVASQIPTFPCTNIGYFPDPSDCTLYHICTRELQETYQCPPQYDFDATNTKCKIKKHFTKCSAIDCTHSLNQYVPYPGHKSYYAYCGKHKITMFKCSDTNNFQFNPKTLNCDFICKSIGWFPNYKNCQQYYECYKINTDYGRGHKWLKSRIQTCPDNFVFDAKRRQCVAGNCSKPKPPACETPVPTTISTESPPLVVKIATDPMTAIDLTTTLETTTMPFTTPPTKIIKSLLQTNNTEQDVD